MGWKLLIYSHLFAPSVGGVESITMTLAEGLAGWSKAHPEDGIEVTVATQTPAAAMDDSRLPFQVVRRPGLRGLARLIGKADAIHLAGPAFLPLALGKLLRKPVFIEHHGYQSICPNGVLMYGPGAIVCPGHFMAGRYGRCAKCNAARIGRAASVRNLALTFPRRWLCKRATGNIAVSLHVAQRISLPRTQTIYHGIEDAVPAAGALPKHPENCLQLGYVGRLVEEKGVRVLLEAAKRLHENRLRFHLKIIGDGPQRAELEKMSRDSGLSECVTFAGLLTGPELQRQVNAIRVMVIPSVCEETAGLAAIEQMMRGEVVVAAEIGGLGEIVGDAGLKFKAGDPESLYRVFKRMIEEPSVITPLPLAARARAMRLFGRENMIQQHVSLYREALRFAKRRESSEVPGGSTDDRANHHFPSGRVDT